MKKIDYRHFILITVILGSIFCSVFLFRNSIFRFGESIRDLGLSLAYYFDEAFECGFGITPTINNLSAYNEFSIFLPENWELFKEKWADYWSLWATKDNFYLYMHWVAHALYVLCNIILIALPFVVIFILLFNRYLHTENNDYNEDSKALVIFKKILNVTYYPIKRWILSFISFIKDHSAYSVSIVCVWLLNWNIFAIIISFFAFYFYLVMSFDFSIAYIQLYKLLLDLTPLFRSFSVGIWCCIIVVALEIIARKVGFNELQHRENKNCGFIQERGIVTIVWGTMGKGKTQLITDMALSKQKILRNQAFEIILESDFKFPYFPWINLELALKIAISKHEVFSIYTCKKWVAKQFRKWYRKQTNANMFDYDYKLYGFEYNDGIKMRTIWDIIEDYSCAYLIYVVQSSLIISNYSIRSDELFDDLGNFPLWNEDFFSRDIKLMDSYSRHSHILDFDMLRLGKRLVENNPNQFAFGFGVYVVSEIDKERKNNLELQSSDKKASDSVCNQKNDLFNACLKMSRHAVVICNRVFLMILGDLQRPEDWGANGRDVGELSYIDNRGDMFPTLPFFAPFYFYDLLVSPLVDKFKDKYIQYRFVRADNTLPMYLAKSIVVALSNIRTRTYNKYGSSVCKLIIESGRMDEYSAKKKEYYLQSAKIYSDRYTTNCLAGIFDRNAELNTVGIDDLIEYAGALATDDELQKQNSFFQEEIKKLK